MSDNDKPITQGQVKKGVAITAGVIGGIVAVGAALFGFLYVLACANMPTGCH